MESRPEEPALHMNANFGRQRDINSIDRQRDSCIRLGDNQVAAAASQYPSQGSAQATRAKQHATLNSSISHRLAFYELAA